MNATNVAALTLSAAGVVAGLVAVVTMRRFGLALAAALELWTAAGLLRLTADATWKPLATAAAIIVIRKLVASTINRKPSPADAAGLIAGREAGRR